MGRSTDADICMNVLQLGNHDTFCERYDEMFELYDEEKDFPQLLMRGWDLVETAKWCGKKKNILGDVLRKGDFEVLMVNSHEYNSVGEHWFEVFSENKRSVEEFLSDFADLVYDATIEDVAAVTQTL